MKILYKPPKWLIFITLPFFAAQLIGQNTNKITPNYRYALKGYLSILHDTISKKENYLSSTTITTQQNQTTALPLIGISKSMKNGSFYEVSLTHLNFIHKTSTDVITSFHTTDSMGRVVPKYAINYTRTLKTRITHVGLRYESDYPILKDYANKIKPFIGISTDPSVYYEHIIPQGYGFFPHTDFEIKNTVTIIPRVLMNLSSRLFFDVHFPIALFSVAYTYHREDNPILPIFAREVFEFKTKSLPSQFNIRIGLGYRI